MLLPSPSRLSCDYPVAMHFDEELVIHDERQRLTTSSLVFTFACIFPLLSFLGSHRSYTRTSPRICSKYQARPRRPHLALVKNKLAFKSYASHAHCFFITTRIQMYNS